MKIRSNISNNTLQVILGLFIAVFVLSQSVYLKPEAKDDAQEQSDDSAPDSAQIVTSEAVPTTTSHINVDFQSYLLEEIGLSESTENKTPFKDYFLTSVNKAMKLLLSRIIAPNAP